MIDPEDARVPPKNIREYVRSFKEVAAVYRWMFQITDTADTRHWIRRMSMTLLLGTLLHALWPQCMSLVVDGLTHRTFFSVIIGGAGFLVVMLGHNLIQYYQWVAREYVFGLRSASTMAFASERLFEKAMIQHIQESTLLNPDNINKGRERFNDAQNLMLFNGIPAIFTLATSFVFLWIFSLVAGGILSLMVIVHIGWMLFLNQRTLAVFSPIEAGFRAFERYRMERWKNMERVKTTANEVAEATGMAAWFYRLINEDRTFWVWYIGQLCLRGAVCSVAVGAIIAYGVSKVWTGEDGWTIGALFPLVGWSMQIVDNLWQIDSLEHRLNWNMPSVRALKEGLSLTPAIPRGGLPVPFVENGIAVKFMDVSHTYARGDEDEALVEEGRRPPLAVLKRVSFTVDPGEKAALIGASGAGKTTIMRLILRYMDPDTGSITINDTDLRELDLAAWLRLVGFIPQHAQILDGTIRYNLTYGLTEDERKEVSDDKLWELMRLLKIDFGARLTAGLETRVGERGIRLSGGEAQRLMIGAAAIKRPPFMLIDEATSSLDSSTERVVQAGLAQVLSQGTSALIIAHRLSTVRHLCTKFIILRPAEEVNGDPSQVEAVGSSFEELFQISPTFRRLATDQGITQ